MKSELRARMRGLLARIRPEERARASAQACALLRRQPVWRSARAVLFYYPLADELDLLPLWREAAEKTRVLPRFDWPSGEYIACVVRDLANELIPGRFGIGEPARACPAIPLNQLDLILVPGVAFDNQGRRLGRGKGYYDRLLVKVSGIKCGVALDAQIQSEIPAEPHDIVVNFILTPTRWLSCGQSAALK